MRHRGVVAWLHVWQTVPPPPATDGSARESAGERVREPSVGVPSGGLADRLVEALASMALAVAGSGALRR